MAGIGFRIEKILENNTLFSAVKAHIYSALISSGPWILSIVTIFCLNYFSPENIDGYEITFFKTTIIYIYAFSLITTGILYLSLSRYLANKLYLKEKDALVPSFNSAALLILVIQTVSGALFFGYVSSSMVIKMFSVMTYTAVSLLWVIMIFLTTLRDYAAITVGYIIGSATAIFGGILLGGIFGLPGYFMGYFLGQFAIAVILSARIFIEFKSRRMFDASMFSFLAENKTLVFIGVAYNLAIWVDKIVMWASQRAVEVAPLLRTFPEYETALFFAYLTIIPTLSIFLISVETGFYSKYRAFYAEILGKGTYKSISEAKTGIIESLKQNISRLIMFQGVVTLVSIAFAPEFAGMIGLKSVSIPIFRIACLGAFVHGLLLINIIVMLYFDLQRPALAVTLIFLFTNGLFAYFSQNADIPFLGYGYFASCLMSLITGYYMLDYKMKRLEYLTFALQPLGTHKEEEST